MKEAFSEVYKKGLAVGEADIRRDEMTFRFKDELFTFPTEDVFDLSFFNGYFYECDVKQLRKLAKQRH